eukprot:SAG11_NODE_12931_length_678_cov_1.291883_1_plen_110_part_10
MDAVDDTNFEAGHCASQGLSILESYYRDHTDEVSGKRSCVLLPQAHVETCASLITADVARNGFFLGREITSTGRSSRTRSLLTLGGPADGYDEMVGRHPAMWQRVPLCDS